MGMGNLVFLMADATKACGKTTFSMDPEYLSQLMEINEKESGNAGRG